MDDKEYVGKIIYHTKYKCLYRVSDQYEGKNDRSYHGSSWYYTYIVCKNLINTDEVVTFCLQKDDIKIATDYIFKLERELAEIGEISKYYYDKYYYL